MGGRRTFWSSPVFICWSAGKSLPTSEAALSAQLQEEGANFPLMSRIYMALAQEDRHPITDIMRQTPEIPSGAQWAIFLRNHDEMTLAMVTSKERDYLWVSYPAWLAPCGLMYLLQMLIDVADDDAEELSQGDTFRNVSALKIAR
jgi:hypothetical protein